MCKYVGKSVLMISQNFSEKKVVKIFGVKGEKVVHLHPLSVRNGVEP